MILDFGPSTWATGRGLCSRNGTYIPVGWSARGVTVYALEEEEWEIGPACRRVYEFGLTGGEPKLNAIFPVKVSDVTMTRDGRRFVATVGETKSDVWMIENFDPVEPSVLIMRAGLTSHRVPAQLPTPPIAS